MDWLLLLKIVLIVIGGIVGFVLFCVILGFLLGLFTGRKKEYDTDSGFYRFVLNSMTGLVLFFTRAKIKVKGLSLPEKGRFLIVGNHRSNWDPIIAWYKFRKHRISYVSKPSNFKVPCYGRVVRRCCFLPIDRGSARNSVKTFDRCAELIKNDVVSFGIYPEGTRSKTLKLLRFHNGVFKIAQKAHVPIVVVCTVGTENIKNNFPWKRTKVILDVLEIIPADRVAEMTTAEIGAEVRQKLGEALIGYGEQPFEETEETPEPETQA